MYPRLLSVSVLLSHPKFSHELLKYSVAPQVNYVNVTLEPTQ